MSSVPRLLFVVVFAVANAASALTFTTHFPTRRVADNIAPSASDNVIYANWSRSLFRSDDGGATFTKRNKNEYIDVAIVDPSNPDIVYYWNLEEVRRSLDGGATWKTIHGALSSISKLLIDPQHPSTLLLSSRCHGASRGTILRSDDRGESWNAIVSGPCVEDMAIDPVTDEIFFTTLGDDAAHDFRIVPAGKIVVSANPRVRYGIGYDVRRPPGAHRVLVATYDGGMKWQRLPLPADAGHLNDLAIDRLSGRLFLAAASGLYVSGHGGTTWQLMTAAPRKELRALSTNSTTLFVQTSNPDYSRAAYAVPLATLEPFTLTGPEVPVPLLGFAIDRRNGVLYASGDGVWRSRDSGLHWESLTGEDRPTRRAITVDAAGDVYTLGNQGFFDLNTVWRYVASTGEWKTTGEGVPYANGQVLVAHPTRPGVLFTSADFWGGAVARLYMTTDRGDHWQPIPAIDDHVVSVATHAQAPDTIYVGTSYHGVFISRDGGVSWTRSGSASQIVLAPSRASRVYGYSDYGIVRSDDSGVTWDKFWLPTYDYGQIAVDPLDENSVWVATVNLYHSTDGGRTWTAEPSNFANDLIADVLAIDPDGSRMHFVAAPQAAYPPYLEPCEWDAVLRSSEPRRAAAK